MTDSYESALRQRNRGFVSRMLPAIAYTGTIFYGGLIRLAKLPETGFVASDKLLHALAFGGLALLLVRAMRWLRPTRTLHWQLIAAGSGASLLGLLLELCQACLSYRSADVWDWVADTVGAALALGLAFGWLHLTPGRARG